MLQSSWAGQAETLPKLRVLLADDHAIIREGLKSLIGRQPDMEVVGEVGDGESALRAVAENSVDIVVMDVTMQGMNGAQATARIKRAFPDVLVLALSMHEDTAYLRGLLEAGASGYVLKRSAPHELIQALRSVAAGGTYLDPAIAGKVAATFTGQSPLRGESLGAPLSNREEAVIRLVATGLTNREIGDRLEVSVKTAETYKSRAMEKLGLASRADIVRYATVQGWFGET